MPNNNDELKKSNAMPPSPYPEPTTGLNPFYRSALPSPTAGVDQVTQITGRYPVPFRRIPPLVPLYAQPTNQVNTSPEVAQAIVDQVNQGTVTVSTLNGVTIEGTPAGLGEVLTSTSATTADWQLPEQVLDVVQLITSQSPVVNVLAYGNQFTGTGKQTYGGTLQSGGGTAFTVETGYDTFAATQVGWTILICATTTSGDVNDFWTTISAVGSPTSITLASATPSNLVRVEEVYWFNPLQDDTVAIQNAINVGGTVYMPHGVYIINATNTPFQYNPQLRGILGDGTQRTVWLAQNANGSFNSRFIHFLDPNYLFIKGITFRGPGIDGVFGGNISLDLQNGSNIERVIIEDIELRNTCSSSAALVVNTPILCVFKNVKAVLNASTGIWLEDPVACSLIDCYCITNVVYGIWIQNGAAVDIMGCACESNGISYYIQDSDNVCIHGCDSEAQVHRAPLPPTSFPTVSVVSGGSIPAGTYFLKYTWLRQWNGNAENLESLPSPESSLVTLTTGNQTIQFTLPVAPTDAPNVKFANIYLTPTNGASGTEGFEHLQTLNSGTTTTVTLSTFTTPTSAPPTVSAIGHSVVIDGSSYVSVSELSSNGLGDSSCFHVWVTNDSNMVSARNVRMFGTPTPTFDVQIDSGCTNCELVTDTSSSLINDLGTNTLIRAGDSFNNLAITGTGTAVTQATGDNSTKIATDAFVQNALANSIPLTNDKIFVGNSSNIAAAVSMSGDTSITNAGAVTVNKLQGTAFTGTTGSASSAVVLATSPTITTPTVSGNLSLGSSTVVAWNSDTGLSRTAADTLALGNGSSGDKSGTLQLLAIQGPGFQKQIFTSSGTFTIPSGITQVKVTVVGAGGAGGGSPGPSPGGASGGMSIKWLSGLTPGHTLTVTVGTGGTGTTTVNTAGGSGTSSSVASGTQTITTITANGGGGSSPGGNLAPSGASAGSGGDINLGGNAGWQAPFSNVGGTGGTSPLTGQVVGGLNASNGSNANSPGGGGSGAGNGSTGVAGGNGANGIVIFEWVN